MKKLTTLFKKSALLLMALMVITVMLPVTQADAASAYVKSLTLSKSSATVKAGSSTTVKATVKVSGSASKNVLVSTSNKSVATVTAGSPKSGVSTITIKGVKKGTATITVKTKAKNSKKVQLKKTIKVTVDYAAVTSLSVSPTSKTVTAGDSFTIKSTVSPSKANQGVTYTSSNSSVASVSTSGKVSAKAAGTATITVKTKGKNKSGSYVSKTVKVTVNAKETSGDTGNTGGDTPAVTTGFTSADYKVTYGETTQYIEFTFDSKTVTKEELEAQGYTVNGSSASKTVTSPTATYTFTKLPSTLEEVKQIKLNDPDDFGSAPMAAAIVALAGQKEASTRFNVTSSQVLQSLEYLNSDKFNIYKGSYCVTDSIPNMFANRYCFFNGATPANGYTPSTPYTFTLELGPYYIPARTNDINYGTTPDRYMILISFAGDDAKRYNDVWKSSNGNWYLWDDTWQHLVAGVKTATVW